MKFDETVHVNFHVIIQSIFFVQSSKFVQIQLSKVIVNCTLYFLNLWLLIIIIKNKVQSGCIIALAAGAASGGLGRLSPPLQIQHTHKCSPEWCVFEEIGGFFGMCSAYFIFFFSSLTFSVWRGPNQKKIIFSGALVPKTTISPLQFFFVPPLALGM